MGRKEHIKNIQNSIKEKDNLRASLVCPRCNSQLVLRDGKYGKFYGCSNYPYCKFTEPY